MPNVFLQGLEVTFAGLGLTFVALGVLIVAIWVLKYFSRTGQLIPEEQQIRETPVVSALARDTEDEEIVAAIAVALAHFRSLDICRSGLGTTLEIEPGPWWHAGQQQQHALGQPARLPSTRLQ